MREGQAQDTARDKPSVKPKAYFVEDELRWVPSEIEAAEVIEHSNIGEQFED